MYRRTSETVYRSTGRALFPENKRDSEGINGPKKRNPIIGSSEISCNGLAIFFCLPDKLVLEVDKTGGSYFCRVKHNF